MSQSVYDIEGLIISNKNPLIGAEVHKYGTATKKTYGLVDGIGINDFKFTIGKKNVNDYPLSNKGDSGAIWILDEGKTLRGVGLHVEGIRGVFATASSLVAIFRELKIGHIFQSQIT